MQLFCLYWNLFPFPHPVANTPTPFKLEIGLAFVGDTEGESIGALITAIHYPNKHGTQPLLDTNSGDVKCLARDKGLDPYCINLRDQTPLSARAPPGSVQPGINLHAQAVSYGCRIQTWSCDMAPIILCCCCGVFSVSLSLSQALNGGPVGPQCSRLTGQTPAPQIPSFLAHSGSGLLHTGPQRLLKAPGRGRR